MSAMSEQCRPLWVLSALLPKNAASVELLGRIGSAYKGLQYSIMFLQNPRHVLLVSDLPTSESF